MNKETVKPIVEINSNPLGDIPAGLEKTILEKLGAKSLDEVVAAIQNENWPFETKAKDLWTIIATYEPTAEDIVDSMTGGKGANEIATCINNKKWPFTVSEAAMREQNAQFHSP